MKLTYVLTTPDVGAGTERTIMTQASLMAARHDVEILGVYRTADRPHYAVDRRLKLRYLVDARGGRPTSRSRLVPAEWDDQFTAETDQAMEAALRGVKADVIITSTPALAALATEFAPRRVVVVHQEHRPPMNRNDGLGPLLSHGARLDLLTNLTERSQTWLAARLGASAPAMKVVENPRTPGFVPRTSLTNPVVIAAGRFAYQKRFDDLIRAFAVADQDVPGWLLRIYGDGPARERLRGLVGRLGLLGKVEVLAPTRRMPAELSKASIYGMSSRYEGLPMVGIEAAAAGLPMVSYDIETGPAEIIGKAGGGLLAPDGSVEALGSSLSALMGDPTLLADMSQRALEGAEHFAPGVIAEQWFDIFSRLGASRGSFIAPIAEDLEDADLPVTVAAPEPAVEVEVIPRVATVPEVQRGCEDALSQALHDAGVSHAWLDVDVARRAVVVAGEDRDSALAAVTAAVYAHGWQVHAFRSSGPLTQEPWSDPADAPVTLARATRLSIAVEKPTGECIAAVDVDFWLRDEDDVLRSPHRNAHTEWVDEPTWREWVARGSATISGQPLFSAVRFPIDVVYTWVDGDDPAWKARREQALAALGEKSADDHDDDALSAARFTSRDEIYFSIRSIKKYAPWVRNIFIVTDAQRPARVLAEFPEVTIVDHRDIFPDPGNLPVFNSHAIETCLHRIEGLAEHFLYFNDDVMLTSPLIPEDFFLGNGVAKFFASPVQIGHGAFDNLPHLAAAANNRELILRDFGFEITQSMLHTPHPHRRSVLEDIERTYAEEIARTRAGRFRSGRDVSVPSSLAQYYGYATGRYVPGQLEYAYLSLRGASLPERMERVLTHETLQVVALGEPKDDHWRHPDEAELVEEFLAQLTQ